MCPPQSAIQRVFPHAQRRMVRWLRPGCGDVVRSCGPAVSFPTSTTCCIGSSMLGKQGTKAIHGVETETHFFH